MANKNPQIQNPIQDIFHELLHPAHVSQKCGAKARSTGEPCKRYASIGHTRCRYHGGAKGSGRPPIHGNRSAQAQRNEQFIRLATGLLNHFYDKPESVDP